MKRWRQTLGLALALLLAAGGCGLPQAADSGRNLRDGAIRADNGGI